ncbi:uncharacterized protein EI90DRAFT_3056224 [Cantharellus anzutake]|uniref:uncharacterized protein n=1 Tax=Cantharellus anzutake TaxID=1750568 RepID=UPI00190382C6|nr:uncharacterized protein EI90DRAFT_3056224 [Cantharellus anzutake]KAF8332002.1 hypothetical protein EI90DRAFT_3056224 [Cantharellus anzutake]
MGDRGVPAQEPFVFARLPFDLHMEIFKWVPPLDIVNLRLTCKYFEQLSRDRVVWLSLLRRQCFEEDVPLQQYELENMSSPELEVTCLRPHVFERMLTRKGSLTFTEQILSFACPTDHEFINEWGKLELDMVWQYQVVPGDRYIVTLYLSGWLRVWDTSAYDSDTEQYEIIASRKFSPCNSTMIVQRSVESPSIITIVVRNGQGLTGDLQDDNLLRRMDVLQLHITNRPWLTDIIASTITPFSARSSLWACDGHHIGVSGPSGNAIIWNYMNDTWVSASIAGSDDLLPTEQCFLDIVGDIVIYVVPDGGLRLYQFKLTKMYASLEEAERYQKSFDMKTFDLGKVRVARTSTMAYWRPRALANDDAVYGASAIDIVLGSEGGNDQIVVPFHFSPSDPAFYPTLPIFNQSQRYLVYSAFTSLGIEVVDLANNTPQVARSVPLVEYNPKIDRFVSHRPYGVELSSFSASMFMRSPDSRTEIKVWRFHLDNEVRTTGH